MNILIDNLALHPRDDEFLFRQGAITGMRRLCDAGYTLQFGVLRLTGQQEKMLRQEGVSYVEDDEAPHAQYTISANGTLLSMAGNDGISVAEAKTWTELTRRFLMPERKAAVHRKTNETDISVEVNLDGTGRSSINTGIAFYDHMLDQIAKHGLVDLTLTCKGDLEIDEHHTIEDTAIALGEAVTQALGDKRGIERFGFVLPMDEAQATVAMDLSGRPYLTFEGGFTREYVGEFPTEMTKHVFHSLAMSLKATLQISVHGENDHHKVEACFKGFARCLRQALARNERILNQVPSSKGPL